ncbi:MAG: aldehyde dehydrogenase family protein, partial [bacterium]|nr:aldehyde dehydrogenase family protein [bacterium]
MAVLDDLEVRLTNIAKDQATCEDPEQLPDTGEVFINGRWQPAGDTPSDIPGDTRFPVYSYWNNEDGSDGIFPEDHEGRRQIAWEKHASKEQGVQAVQAAKEAWEDWALTSWEERAECLKNFAAIMRADRDRLARLLMLEIAKTEADAYAEVDRTADYIDETIRIMLEQPDKEQILYKRLKTLYEKRAIRGKGVVVGIGPRNYPLNELIAALVSALAVGNTVVAKGTDQGNLALIALTKKTGHCFPPGVFNLLYGNREALMGIQEQVANDVAAVVGFVSTEAGFKINAGFNTDEAATQVELGMTAKNRVVIMPDADLDKAVEIVIKGSLSYNGQRCTAIKDLLIHEDVVEKFTQRLVDRIDRMKMGSPTDKKNNITPLLNLEAAQKQERLVDNALEKGAKIANSSSSTGKARGAYFFPTILSGVTDEMEIAHVEQYGPTIPIKSFRIWEEVVEVHRESPYGQQAVIVTRDPENWQVQRLRQELPLQVQQVWINLPPGRGPDDKEFGGAKAAYAIGNS